MIMNDATAKRHGSLSSSAVTISDVIHKLNTTIRSQMIDDVDESNNHTNTTTTKSKERGFELHTRLPDGSSRPANDIEISKANFECKLQHVMATLQSFEGDNNNSDSDTLKLNWAEHERVHVGNVYYQNQQYEEAMDVYLTCLTVAAPPSSSSLGEVASNDTKEQNIATKHGNTNETTKKYTIQHFILYMKLMNNLALCTLQLKWYRKTIIFCTMTLDQITISLPSLLLQEEEKLSISVDEKVVLVEQHIKLFYKRSKAYRLRGEYDLARFDIKTAQNKLQSNILDKNDFMSSSSSSLNIDTLFDSMRTTIQKEEQLLQRAVYIGTQHSQKQQKAMEQLLQPHDQKKNSDTNITKQGSCIHPLYDKEMKQRRTYSTLRAKSSITGTIKNHTSNPTHKHDQAIVQSYYVLIVTCWNTFVQIIINFWNAIFGIASNSQRKVKP